MKSEIKAAVISGSITGILGIVGTVLAAIIGKYIGEKNVVVQLYSQIPTITDDSNTITINNVDEFIEQFIKDYVEPKNRNEDFESQLSDCPDISYKDLGLCMNGEDIPVNKNHSMINIDGRDYISREIVEKLISDDENFTIKDETLFIGKVIVEKSSLIDGVIVDSGNILTTNNIKDSYGNLYTNALYPQNYHSYMIVNLNRQFSFLKLRLAVQENGHSDAIVTIIADDKIVYTSPSLTVTTEPFDVTDIPINNCSLLTIKIDSGADNGMGKGFDCIISDPEVYN